jgi:phosphoribosyl 1,2-cyclic phosphodiesterase
MALFISSLNSGSNANCYYIGNEREAVLVDAGLSCRETEKRMLQLELPMEKLKALFISHEHGDHITGVAGIAKKYRLPVYITAGTLQSSGIPIEPSLLHSFSHNRAVKIGALSILPFRKSHDASDPHSFIVSDGAVHVGVITDIGYACKQVLKHFSRCDAAFLEANYCETMLANGSYPYHLKKRISSDEGHLSNRQALELFLHYRSARLQLLVLSHLSKNNNKPALVESLFAPHAGATRIVVASRYTPTPVFCIATPGKTGKPSFAEKRGRQLSLF